MSAISRYSPNGAPPRVRRPFTLEMPTKLATATRGDSSSGFRGVLGGAAGDRGHAARFRGVEAGRGEWPLRSPNSEDQKALTAMLDTRTADTSLSDRGARSGPVGRKVRHTWRGLRGQMSTAKNAPNSSRSDEPPSSRPGRGRMPPQVWAVAAHIILRMGEAAVEDMRARYELGRLAHELRYHPCDQGILVELARAHHLKPGTLRRYARVTEMISSEEFDEYLTLRSPYGLPLTWSQIEELAESRSRDVRRRCAAEVLSEALSISELRARVRACAMP